MSPISEKMTQIIFDEYDRLNLWCVVFFIFGITFYFGLPFEPSLIYGIIALILSIGCFLIFRKKEIGYLLGLCLIFTSFGFLRIQIQTQWVEHPFLKKNYSFSDVTGKIEKLEHLPSAVRVTLNVKKIDDKIPKDEQPQFIRIRLNGKKNLPKQGDVIHLKATLSPPMLPTFPDGYPFARKAYSKRLVL